MKVSSIETTPASADERRTGLLAYVSLSLDDELRVDGITARRTKAGGFCLSFPERRYRRGRRHAIVLPLNARARASLEAAVLAELEAQALP